MPISYQISGGLITVSIAGQVQSDDLAKIATAIYSDPAYKDGLNLLIDSRNSTANLSASEIRARAVLLKTLVGGRPLRIAFVVTGSLRFGLARMICIYAQMDGLNIQPFEDIEEAIGWLEHA